MPGNPHAIRVGANVRAEMARRSLTQTALADQLKVTQQKLSRCISGQQAFRVDELHRVAEVLGVSMSELIGEEKASA